MITPGVPDVPTIPDPERLRQLREAAVAYGNGFTDGEGAPQLAVNVGKNKTKGKAVKTWVDSIWTLYYTRLDLVNAGQWQDSYLDFTSCGTCPATLRELMAEEK